VHLERGFACGAQYVKNDLKIQRARTVRRCKDIIKMLSRNTNMMPPCNRIYYSKVFFEGLTCFERHTAHHQEL
jgi:hypothetical protein